MSVSRVAVCSKHQRTTAVSKQDLSHLELGHVIDVHQHFHHVLSYSCILWGRCFIQHDT